MSSVKCRLFAVAHSAKAVSMPRPIRGSCPSHRVVKVYSPGRLRHAVLSEPQRTAEWEHYHLAFAGPQAARSAG